MNFGRDVPAAANGARMKAGMKRLFVQVEVMIATLVTVGGECVARCASEPCHETAPVPADPPNTPPCHQHQSKSQPAPQPKPCQLSFESSMNARELANTQLAPRGAALVLPVSHQPPPFAQFESVFASTARPPLLYSFLSPDVLRI